MPKPTSTRARSKGLSAIFHKWPPWTTSTGLWNTQSYCLVPVSETSDGSATTSSGITASSSCPLDDLQLVGRNVQRRGERLRPCKPRRTVPPMNASPPGVGAIGTETVEPNVAGPCPVRPKVGLPCGSTPVDTNKTVPSSLTPLRRNVASRASKKLGVQRMCQRSGSGLAEMGLPPGVGNGCWIDANPMVFDGVTVADGAKPVAPPSSDHVPSAKLGVTTLKPTRRKPDTSAVPPWYKTGAPTPGLNDSDMLNRADSPGSRTPLGLLTGVFVPVTTSLHASERSARGTWPSAFVSRQSTRPTSVCAMR